jgi:hypothetical protein
MAEEKDYIKYVMNQRVTKSFSTDMKTLGMIMDFKEKYHYDNFSRAIDDLINVGLANFGYRTEKEIETRFKGTEVNPKKITIPSQEEIDTHSTEELAKTYSRNQYEQEQLIIDIIKKLSEESSDKSAYIQDILIEAKIQGINTSEVEEAIHNLCRDGTVYKTPQGKFGIL